MLSAVNQPNILDRLNMSESCCGINRFMLDKQRGYYTYCEVINNFKKPRTSQSTKASGRCGKQMVCGLKMLLCLHFMCILEAKATMLLGHS